MTLTIVFDHTIKDKHIINPYSTESWLFTLKIGKRIWDGSDGQNNRVLYFVYGTTTVSAAVAVAVAVAAVVVATTSLV